MAIVIESVSTGVSPITKPTGLAVGDLMVAIVSQSYNVAFPSASTPSGWTSETSGFDPRAHGLFWKVADSSDVAASDFTFKDSANNHMTGALYRLSGADADEDLSFAIFNGADTDTNTTGTVATGIAPVYAISHFFGGYLVIDDATNGTMSTYGLGGSPTFTERIDTALGAITTFSVADAPISSLTALGNATVVTTATTPSIIRIFGMLIYAAKINAVADPAFFQLTPQIYQTIPQMITATPSIYAVTPVLHTPTWTNADKNAATNVTNQDKV